MAEQQNNNISIYAPSVSAGQKKRFLASYCEYVSLVRNLESIVRSHSLKSLAYYQSTEMFPEKELNVFWNTEEITPEEKQLYQDFLENKPNIPEKYGFVSLDLSANPSNNAGILSVPTNYISQTQGNTLPNRIERYITAYPYDARLKKTRFIINGTYILAPSSVAPNISLKDAMEISAVEKRFGIMLDMLVQLPEKIYQTDEKTLQAVHNESLVSELTAPFENLILTALSALTEETNNTLKAIGNRRRTDSYIYLAEQFGLIPSSARFQDYQNIRHLMSHQWDTLDNIGRFTYYDIEKNASIRHRYQDGYNRLCNKSVQERIDSYIEASKDFAGLALELTPNLFIRREGESNNKFIARLKEFAKNNKEEPILIETAYPATSEKKQALIKNISKLFPTAQIIDHETNNSRERLRQYFKRKNFLELYAETEYAVCRHCLFHGKNQPSIKCWQEMSRHKVLTPEETKRWGEYKKLRNELSHHHMNDTMVQQLEDVYESFFYDALELTGRLKQVEPRIILLEGKIYRAIHPSGKIVDIDFEKKQVLRTSIADKSTYTPKLDFKQTAKNYYTEEYANGFSITTQGTQIVSCRFPNGIIVDFSKQRLVYPDKYHFYFNSAEHYSLSTINAKVLTDKTFRLVNYIQNGKSVNISKNETILLPANRKIKIGADFRLISDIWTDEKGEKQKQTYHATKNGPSITIADGTTLSINPLTAVLSHKGIELSYKTRKSFVESYNDTPPTNLFMASNNKSR